MQAQRLPRKPPRGLLRRYSTWLAAIAVLSITWHFTHPGTESLHRISAAKHKQQAAQLLSAMEHVSLRLDEKAGNFEKESADFNQKLVKQNNYFAKANKEMEKEKQQKPPTATIAVSNPLPLPPAPAAAFIMERSRRKDEFIHEQAAAMFSKKDHHAARMFIKKEHEKILKEEALLEQRAAKKHMNPHVFDAYEAQAHEALIAEKEANWTRHHHRHRPRPRHKAAAPEAPMELPPPPFQSAFSVRLVEELINRMRAEGKDIDPSMPDEDLETAVLSGLEREAAMTLDGKKTRPMVDGKPVVFERNQWRVKKGAETGAKNEDSEGEEGADGAEDSEKEEEEEEEEMFEEEEEDDTVALEKIAKGVVDTDEAYMEPPGPPEHEPQSAAPPGSAAAKESAVLQSWVSGQQKPEGNGGDSGAGMDEQEEVYNVKAQKEKMRALVKAAVKARKEAQQPPASAGSQGKEDEDEDASVNMAKVINRCMGAPAPWMPRPYGYRKGFRAFEREVARREERENPQAPPPPPSDVVYYKVPKNVDVYDWIAKQNSKVQSAFSAEFLTKNDDRLSARNKKHVTADRSGKAVVDENGSLVHMSYGEYREKYPKWGKHPAKGGRTLLGNKGDRKLYQISSFCSGKLQHRAWQSCISNHVRQRCSAEAREPEEPKPYTAELAGCVADTQHCKSRLPHLRHLTSRLPSIAALAISSPGCLLHNDESESCGELGSNKETAGYMGRCGKRGGGPGFGCNINLKSVPVLKSDIKERWETCAVVGSSPSLLKEKNGHSIDKHEAVFRVFGHSPGHIDKRSMAKHAGSRTTVAVFGRAAGIDLLQDDETLAEVAERAHYAVFWHYHTAQYLEHLQETYQNTTVSVMSSQLVNWQLRMHGQLKSDLERIGLGPLPCSRFMSSGMHALLLALQTCRSVNLFGFGVMPDEGKKQTSMGGRQSETATPLETYSVATEAKILRLLWLAGAADVCTSDV